MDNIVTQAMKKWPNVPDCYGWLGLDARGHWFMRDDNVQRNGEFASGGLAAKGSLLSHKKLIEFIQRNYAADDAGQWYFQNGPQRVYVELEATPWIWRVDQSGSVESQTGLVAKASLCLTDEFGKVYLDTNLGIGLVHSMDVPIVADALDEHRWPVKMIVSDEIPKQYGFVRSPIAMRAIHI